MLNKYRIGNNISVRWSLYDAIGHPVNIEDRNISIELHVGSKVIPIDDFEKEENTVSFVFLGSSQVYTGTYSICLSETSGNSSVLTIDEYKIFVLVDHTWESDNELSTDFNVEFGSALSGVIGPSQGAPGTPAGFGTIDAEIYNDGEEPTVEVETSGPDTAKNIHFRFSGINGLPGASGAAAGFGEITAEVDGNPGTPSCVITTSGPDTAKNIHFAFHGIVGQGGGGGGASDPTGFLSALTFDQTTRKWTLNGRFQVIGDIVSNENIVASGEITAGETE